MSLPTRSICYIFQLLIPCLILPCLIACHKEPALSPSASNLLYQLPQGNHPYDQAIGQFYDSFRTVILYKFDSVDFNYTFAGPANPGYTATIADSNDIQQGLDFIHAQWLDLYPSSFLQQCLPFKILLASNIQYDNVTAGVETKFQVAAISGSNQVTFGLVNDSLSTLTLSEVDSTRGVLNRAFWRQAIMNSLIARPMGFDALTNYTNGIWNLKQNGIITQRLPLNPLDDFLDYIQLITSTDQATLNNTWLSPGFDTYGMYTQKYNLITSYYLTNYGVDLQAIGNKQ